MLCRCFFFFTFDVVVRVFVCAFNVYLIENEYYYIDISSIVFRIEQIAKRNNQRKRCIE